MLILISPAKTLDFDTPPTTRKHSQPRFLADSQMLIDIMRRRSPAELGSLMHISDDLAELNARRFAEWSTPFEPDNAKQALLAFRGDVYNGLEADSFSARDLNFAQDHLRILSGLYGVLRPLDLIQPYRLEMGTGVQTPRGNNLYEFWKDSITASLSEELGASRSPLTVNLASQEYFGAVAAAALPGRLVTPVFKDLKNGQYKIISFFAKKARGQMASWILRNRIRSAVRLKEFDGAGYAFNAEATAAAHSGSIVFTRDLPV